jgi:2,3-bisphosphoglycerate-dependent phosphoglycerate mutase
MKTLRLILVRHGQTDHNTGLRLTGWGDPPLDELGLFQAEHVAIELTEKYHIGALYASPLQRALQTAKPLKEKTGLTIQIHEGLKELHFGEVEGMTFPEAKEKYPDHFIDWRTRLDLPEFSWPGGETRIAFHTRVDRALWDIIVTEAGRAETVAIVAHGGTLAGFISELETGEPYAWRRFLLENCQYYIVEVHFEQTPLTRDNCTLQIVHTGKLMPMPEDI